MKILYLTLLLLSTWAGDLISSVKGGSTVLVLPAGRSRAGSPAPSPRSHSPRWNSPLQAAMSGTESGAARPSSALMGNGREKSQLEGANGSATVAAARPPSALAIRRKGQSPHVQAKALLKAPSSGASVSPQIASMTVVTGVSPSSAGSSSGSHDVLHTPRTPAFSGVVAVGSRVPTAGSGVEPKTRLEDLIRSDMPATHFSAAGIQPDAGIPGHMAHMSTDLTSLAGLGSVVASKMGTAGGGGKESAEAQGFKKYRRKHNRHASMSLVHSTQMVAGARNRGSFIAALHKMKKAAQKPKLPFIAYTALRDNQGDTALNLACDAIDYRTVHFLIHTLDACPNIRDRQARTPLMAVCRSQPSTDEDIEDSLRIFNVLIDQPNLNLLARDAFDQNARKLAVAIKNDATEAGNQKLVHAKEHMIKKLDELFFKQREANRKFSEKDALHRKIKADKARALAIYFRDEVLEEPQAGCCGCC